MEGGGGAGCYSSEAFRHYRVPRDLYPPLLNACLFVGCCCLVEYTFLWEGNESREFNGFLLFMLSPYSSI